MVGILAAVAFGEWVRMKGVSFSSPPAWAGWAAMEGIFLWSGDGGGLLPTVWPGIPPVSLEAWVWAGVLLFFLFPVFLRNEFTVPDTAYLFFGALYLGLLFRDFVLLRVAFANGWSLCLLVLLSVWATDIAAYFVGSWLKGPKLAPVLSPNKTVSGSVAGVAASMVPGLLMAAMGAAPLPTSRMILLGIVASVAGQLGDLAESALKRTFGVKDAGHLLPGHGGVLDRFDSLLLAGSVAYHLLVLWL